jgi:hypothetical protein
VKSHNAQCHDGIISRLGCEVKGWRWLSDSECCNLDGSVVQDRLMLKI